MARQIFGFVQFVLNCRQLLFQENRSFVQFLDDVGPMKFAAQSASTGVNVASGRMQVLWIFWSGHRKTIQGVEH
jgi:hypothetical protein